MLSFQRITIHIFLFLDLLLCLVIYIYIILFQRRLRHLRSISARNVTGIDVDDSSLAFTLHRKPDLCGN